MKSTVFNLEIQIHSFQPWLWFFRYFGVGAAIFGLIYFLYEYFYAGGFAIFYREELQKKKTEPENNVESLEPFLDAEKPIVKEKSDLKWNTYIIEIVHSILGHETEFYINYRIFRT